MRARLYASVLVIALVGGVLGPSAQAGPPPPPPPDWDNLGNAGTVVGTNFVGTTDNVAFNVRVNNLRAQRFEPGSTANLIGGHPDNITTPGVVGATVGGGGTSGEPNLVFDDFGTVGGGTDNQVGDDDLVNTQTHATVGGGLSNAASGSAAALGGGHRNTASGNLSFLGGGLDDTAGAEETTVTGGLLNTASAARASIGGGSLYNASGFETTIAGGRGRREC